MKMLQKNKAGEPSVVSTVVAAICIVIYLVSLVQAAVRLYLSVDKQKIQADYDFQSLGNIVTSSGSRGFMNEPFITSINSLLASSNTIEAVIIFGPSVEYAFEKQRGATITWVNNTPRIINKFNIYTQGLYKTFPLDNMMNVSIQAAARVFNYTVISKILKETLIFILIGFALAFFTMLLQLLLGKTEDAEAEENNESSPFKHEFSPVDIRLSEPVNVRVNEPVNIHIHETAKTPQSGEPISVRVNEPVNVHIHETVQAPSHIQAPPPVHTPVPPPPPVHAPPTAPSHDHAEPAPFSEENLIDDGSGPKGLYSPRSHIGWEEYLNDRLDSELHRCASTEKDLTLLMLEFKDKITNYQFKDAAQEASSLFTTRDLLFEKGEQGISVIMPGVDLDTGLSKARKFQERIKEKLFSKSATDECAYIGLSSRAGRLLNADRLKLEANEALKKAKADSDTSIIAFKSDLEKYRKFIASQNQSRS
jgi:GGDEF domain-containing protein